MEDVKNATNKDVGEQRKTYTLSQLAELIYQSGDNFQQQLWLKYKEQVDQFLGGKENSEHRMATTTPDGTLISFTIEELTYTSTPESGGKISQLFNSKTVGMKTAIVRAHISLAPPFDPNVYPDKKSVELAEKKIRSSTPFVVSAYEYDGESFRCAGSSIGETGQIIGVERIHNGRNPLFLHKQIDVQIIDRTIGDCINSTNFSK